MISGVLKSEYVKQKKKKKGFNAKIKINFYTSYATSLISIHIIQFMIEKCVEFEKFCLKLTHISLCIIVQ